MNEKWRQAGQTLAPFRGRGTAAKRQGAGAVNLAKRNEQSRNRAKHLRSEMSPVERKLWTALRAGRLQGIKFVRQHPIGPYSADFAVRSDKLVIELDGDSHAGREDHDAQRTDFMKQNGYRVIRFSNGDVMANLDGVLRAILTELGHDPESPRPF